MPADEALEVGAKAPGFELEGTGSAKLKLSDLLKKGPVALFFYPGDNTPGCNRQLSGVRDDQAAYRKHKVTTIGMNPAGMASHEKYVAGFKFNFPLLSDAERSAAKDYRALKPDGKGIQRTVYLIGQDGRILFSQRGMPATEAILAPLGA
ncbi:MAG TPA: peroxiredoxin [Gemmatimonadales bacterium]|jgi:peroxiredoxin Q/BCP